MASSFRRSVSRLVHRTVPAWLVRGLGGVMVASGVSVPWIGEALGWWAREVPPQELPVQAPLLPMPAEEAPSVEDEPAAVALPSPVVKEPVAERTTDVAPTRAPADVVTEWCERVVEPMNERFKGRYPFDAGAENDATLADFERFFHPANGEISKARDELLAAYVVVEGGTAKLRENPGGPSINPAVIRFLNRARNIGAVMFPRNRLTVAFSLALQCNPNIRKINLTVDGQMIEYSCNADSDFVMRWPGEHPYGAGLEAFGRSRRKTVVRNGEWALFRLLELPPSAVPAFEGDAVILFHFDFKTFDLGVLEVKVKPVLVRGGSAFFGLPGGDRKFLSLVRARDVLPPQRLFNGVKGCKAS